MLKNENIRGQAMALQSEPDIGFRPLHKGHAIEQVAIVIAVDKEIGDEHLKRAKDAIGKPEDLPTQSEMSGVSFSIGNNMVVPVPTAPSIAGYLFQKKGSEEGIEAELTLQRNTIAFRTNLYTRWGHVWEQGRRHIERLLPIYMQSARLSQISLSYIDKFLWDGPEGKCDTNAILTKNSPYLAPEVLRAKDLWHCHTGSFVRVNDFTKRLVNVNVDYLDAPYRGEPKRTISIRTVLVDMFYQPGYGELQAGADSAARIVHEHLEGMHDLDKSILKSILTPDMARRIALL